MSNQGKHGVGKRGVVKCKKKLSEEEMHNNLDENNIVIGGNASYFASQLRKKMRGHIPYWLKTKEIPKETWKNLWLELKEIWHIPNDDAEKHIISQAKKVRTDALSKMFRQYEKTGINPCNRYSYLDATKWEAFVAARSTPEARAKSEKARNSAKQNKNPARLGRKSYGKLKQELPVIWPKLKVNEPILNNMEDTRCQLLVAGRRKKVPKTDKNDVGHIRETTAKLIDAEKNMKRDGSYGDRESNPIIQVFGDEHGGRTRAVSSVIGKTQVRGGFFKGCRERVEASPVVSVSLSRQSVDPIPAYHNSASTVSHIVYPDIEEVCRCELLWAFNSISVNLVLANAQAYPTSDRYLDDMLIHNHCVKVQVDHVNQDFLNVPVPEEAIKKDEIILMKDTLNMFIQWRRRGNKDFKRLN